MTDTSMDVYRDDLPSQNRVGILSQTLGFPLSGLCYVDLVDAEDFADRVLARQANVINRPQTLRVSTLTDPGWWAILPTIDPGKTSLTVRRTGLEPPDDLTFRCIVTGITHRIRTSPAKWEADIQLATIEQTL